jgi:hypothetical protein
MEVSKTMKSGIEILAFLGLAAMCMIAMPAFSMPAGNGAQNAPCNTASDKANCNAWAGGMGNPGMGLMGGPEMGIRGMGPAGMNKWKNESWNHTKAVEIRQAGNGFAIGDSKNHILRMDIEGKISPNLADIQKLVSDNKTLAQIKSDIKAKMDAEISEASYNGSLRLGASNYNLANIKLTPSKDNSSTIEADVVGPKLNANDKPTTTAGHISVTTFRQENSTIGEGTLTMSAGQYAGKYKVLLQMGNAWGKHNGLRAYAFGGISQKEKGFGMNKRMGLPNDRAAQKASSA